MRTRKTAFLATFIVLPLCLCGCVSESEYKDLASRVEYLESLHGITESTTASPSEPVVNSSAEGKETKTNIGKESEDEVIIGTATITTASLNVRSEPGQTSTRVGALTNGQIVDVIEITEGGTWAKIIFNGKIGYAKTEFLDISYADESLTITTSSDPDYFEEIKYEKIDLGNVETTYPVSGKLGLNKDRASGFLEIENITIEPSNSYVGDDIGYRLNFIGTNPYSNSVSFIVKQYDKDGFCISEDSGNVRVVRGERVRESGSFFMKSNAVKAIIEIKASYNAVR